ncbi:MAG: hypothetical protein ABGW78_00420 [Pirellulales bacterium]
MLESVRHKTDKDKVWRVYGPSGEHPTAGNIGAPASGGTPTGYGEFPKYHGPFGGRTDDPL